VTKLNEFSKQRMGRYLETSKKFTTDKNNFIGDPLNTARDNPKVANRIKGSMWVSSRMQGKFTKLKNKKRVYTAEEMDQEDKQLDEFSKSPEKVKKWMKGSDISDVKKSMAKGKFKEKMCKDGDKKACKEFKESEQFEEDKERISQLIMKSTYGLDETSKAKLGRYIKAAKTDLGAHEYDMGKVDIAPDTKNYSKNKDKWKALDKEAISKSNRRITGINRAVDRLTKEDVDHDAHRTAMVHAVTQYDIKQEQAAKKNPKRYHNRYALGHYLGAVDRVHGDMKSGVSHGDAINNHFNGALARHLHKTLKTGDTDVDSKRRKAWGEETEQLDEIGYPTLDRYTGKVLKQAQAMGVNTHDPKFRQSKRGQGLTKATDRYYGSQAAIGKKDKHGNRRYNKYSAKPSAKNKKEWDAKYPNGRWNEETEQLDEAKMNPLTTYHEAGSKAAQARKQGDESRAKFHSDWARKAFDLEKGEHKAKAQDAFKRGYRGDNLEESVDEGKNYKKGDAPETDDEMYKHIDRKKKLRFPSKYPAKWKKQDQGAKKDTLDYLSNKGRKKYTAEDTQIKEAISYRTRQKLREGTLELSKYKDEKGCKEKK
jgi:hypothetical protein